MSRNTESVIIRPVQVLRGYKNIAAALRTSEDKVRDMIAAGAPVAMEGDMPKAEAAEMWAWYVKWLGLRKKAAGDGEA